MGRGDQNPMTTPSGRMSNEPREKEREHRLATMLALFVRFYGSIGISIGLTISVLVRPYNSKSRVWALLF